MLHLFKKQKAGPFGAAALQGSGDRRRKEEGEANIVTEPRQTNATRRPFCTPRVRKGEYYAPQGACSSDKERRPARSDPASRPPDPPLEVRAPFGPYAPSASFSLLGHGSPLSSSSAESADDDDGDDDSIIPAGQPGAQSAIALDEGEYPFLGDAFPPRL